MKTYKIVEECCKANNDYTVETYTDSFVQVVELLTKCDDSTKYYTESITLFALLNGSYVKIGVIG